MTGNLDRPLGVPKPSGRKNPHILRYLVIGMIVIATGTLGYAGRGFVDWAKDKPAANGDQIALQKNSGSGENETSTQIATKTPAKRPDLPVDNTAPGLRQLDASGELEVPVIIPRKRPDDIARKQFLAHLPDPELIEKSSFGQLPIISSDGLRPLDVYSRQAETEGNFGVARIVIIVGGLGISQTSTEQAIRILPPGVTLAFAPYGNSLSRWMSQARKSGHELLMQVPMEPFGYPQTTAGKHSLLSSADAGQNKANLLWSLGRITNYVGVMNYLGGKLLTSPNQLAPILDEISNRGLMFVDDGSIRNSTAGEVSKSSGLPFTRAHMTIDSLRTRTAIGKKLKELEANAKRTGLAIGVATAFPESIAQIANFLKNAKKRGLELTPVSVIASKPEG